MKTGKMHYTRLLACLLALSLLTGLSACGNKTETVTAPAAAATETPAAAEATAAPAAATETPALSEAEQRQILEAERELWAFDEGEYAPDWFYTFTDLDHNGLLEVLSASTQGSGMFTYAHFYEVLPDGSGVKNLYHADAEIEGPDDWPEIILESLPCGYDAAADRYYYACEGVTRDGAAHSLMAWYVLSLKDGAAEWELLAAKELELTEGSDEPRVSCTDASGEAITEHDYDKAVERRFDGLEESRVKLDWTAVRAPQPTPEPIPVGPLVAVTKDPSSEALTIGGKTWFIAHADNALSLTWEIADPEGNIYSLDEAMARHAGLSLEALEGDTVAVSNVPLSLNGWGVRARFDGEGNCAYSAVAYIYVGDYVAAYGDVIQAYKTAYESGNNGNIEYVFTHELSEFVVGSSHAGYAFKDLDKDGTPELIIADTDAQADKVLFALYTLGGGKPKALAVSTARDCYYLRSDSTVLNEASGGAAYTYRYLLRKSGEELAGFEGVLTGPAGGLGEGVRYYYQTGTTAYELRPGDQEITEAEYFAKCERYESSIYLPQLSRIA